MKKDDARAFQEAVLENSAAIVAAGIMFKALIATHPDQKTLRRSVDALFGSNLAALRDVGFEGGRAPGRVRDAGIDIRKNLDHWLGAPPK